MKNEDKMGTKNILPLLVEFSIPAIIGMLVNAIYNIVDRMFIGNAPELGAIGLAGISICYPVTLVLMAISLMIGMGGATRFSIALGQGKKEEAGKYMGNGLTLTIILGLVFMILGNVFLAPMLRLLGASKTVLPYAESYLSIILYGAVFQCIAMAGNNFSRAQGNPKNAMISQLIGAGFNILFDYIFMFPLNLGFLGAALATALSPVVTMLVCSTHYLGKNNHVEFHWRKPSLRRIIRCCQLGVSAFFAEISSAVITIIFNMLILRIAGNIGIAAYGVVANISLVAMAILNGFAQGAQPLISQSYGKGEHDLVRKFLNWSLAAALLIELVIVVLIYGFTDTFISIFNSEHNLQLLAYAHTGLRLYFLGFLVAGINIVLVAYFSAIDRARPAVLGSVMRGIIAIAFCAILFSQILGLNGFWLSFLGSEIITFFVILIFRKS